MGAPSLGNGPGRMWQETRRAKDSCGPHILGPHEMRETVSPSKSPRALVTEQGNCQQPGPWQAARNPGSGPGGPPTIYCAILSLAVNSWVWEQANLSLGGRMTPRLVDVWNSLFSQGPGSLRGVTPRTDGRFSDAGSQERGAPSLALLPPFGITSAPAPMVRG